MARSKFRRHILVARFSALGDVAMTVVPLYSVCRRHPDKAFYFLTRPHAATLFINPPENLRLIKVAKGDADGIFGLWRLQRAIVGKYRIDTFIDLHDVIRTKILRFLFFMDGATVRKLHKERSARRMLTRRKDKVFAPLRTTIHRYSDALMRTGLECDTSFSSILPENDDLLNLYRATRKEGMMRIAIAPFAAHRAKQYPLERMEKIVAALSARGDVEIILMGNSQDDRESSIMNEWQEKYTHVSAKECAKPMRSQLACLASCDAVISMDSANMHMASLVGTRVVSIWGGTHPYAGFYGHGQDMRDAVQCDMPCRPCSVFGKRPCRTGSYKCIDTIEPETVISTLFRDGLLPTGN